MAKTKETEETAAPGSELDRYNELVAEKMAAGLPHETAAECAKRQLAREAEAKAG
jgi:hypothetical protein